MRPAAVAATAVALLAACGDGGGGTTAAVADARAEQARKAAGDAGLPADVGDVLALAARVVSARFTVDYRIEGGGTASLAQDPPRRRVEQAAGEGGTRVVRVLISRKDGSFTCLHQNEQWRCQQATSTGADPGPFPPSDVERTVDELAAARSAYDFTVENRRLAGVDARCLVTTLKPGQPPDPARGPKGELCLSPEGAPLLVTGTSNSPALRAVRYRRSVDGDAFELPAAPTTTSTAR